METDTYGSMRSVTNVEHEKRNIALAGVTSASVENSFIVDDAEAVCPTMNGKSKPNRQRTSLATGAWVAEQVALQQMHKTQMMSLHASTHLPALIVCYFGNFTSINLYHRPYPALLPQGPIDTLAACLCGYESICHAGLLESSRSPYGSCDQSDEYGCRTTPL